VSPVAKNGGIFMNRTDFWPTPANWWAVQLIGFGLVLLALSAWVVGRAAANHKDEEKETTLTALPQEVRDGLDRAARTYSEPLTDTKWSGVEQLGGADDPLYRLRGKNGRGRTIEVELTVGGRVIEVEEFGVPLSEIPAAAFEGLKLRFPNANPDWVAAIYQAGNPHPVAYGFGGRGGVGGATESYVTADGRTFLN